MFTGEKKRVAVPTNSDRCAQEQDLGLGAGVGGTGRSSIKPIGDDALERRATMVEDYCTWERRDDEVESLWLDRRRPACVVVFARKSVTRPFRRRICRPKQVCAAARGGELGTRPAGSSALLSAKRVTCVSALLRPLGGSRFLVVALAEGRPDTQRTLSGRLRAAEAVAKCFSFLAGLELGEDLPCLTVDDDEWLQGAELWGDRGTMAARVPAG